MDLLDIAVAALVGGVTGYFTTFMTEKGKNVATKQDVGEITDKIESVKTTHAKDFESVRSELQRASVEHQVRFSKLHEKRADILAQINSALTDAAWAAEQAANPMGWADDPPKEEQAVTAINAVASAFRLFDHNRIYLPPALCDQIEKFIRDVRKPMILLQTYFSIKHPIDKTKIELLEHQARTLEWIRNDMAQMRAAIEAEFRKLLGHE